MTEPDSPTPNEAPGELAALLAQYAGPEELLEAALQVRQAGYRRWDTHSPFPVHGIDRAMGIRPTILPWLVFAGGLTGGLVALGLQWWTNTIDYPLLTSGKPLFSLPANIPIIFELVILFAALTTFFGVMALNGLPQFWHPTFDSRRFARFSSDGFFLSIEARDPKFNPQVTRELLEATGAAAIDLCYAPARGREIPAAVWWGLATVACLALLPPLGTAWYRLGPKAQPRIHPIQDMDFQPKYKAQAPSGLFADGRAARPPVAGTVAREQLEADRALYQGKVDDQWVTEYPIPVDLPTMLRGQERFNVYCAPCHGLVGEGEGMVAQRAAQRAEPSWVPPLSIHADAVRQQPLGQLFHTITNGIRTMPAYGPQIPAEDRWAILLYVQALQRSQHTTLEDVPAELRSKLR